ncbi:MAG: iron-containing alcohol dehydrogenase, partial [Planctomycetaceae bacterium]
MRFEFSTTDRIVFASGAADQLAEIAIAFGNRAFLVLGGNPDRFNRILDQLASAGIVCEFFPVTGEPTRKMAQAAVLSARWAQSQVVIAIGGGSAIDTGKVVAAMLRNEGELLDYLEVVG